ncbi:asparagine synthase (glutamine-hydrolyzing) [Variovorax sp. JS1663]|uniref:asparagine synthase (glutamine-hydrolyzing) n=1 Tax=Variovorax sp. JS1663 TaxID=1851577 RepID=UPI000B34123C|nr:asparagine synthase (glutamine-hydrolyzing) [Variovorax sp. JS1663]OUL99432.1 asparagine synthase (glutamine-hydrolyzing) [Variovorax sp. JS1663]
MCGFVGFLSARAAHWGEPVLRDMANAIARRGPDDAGYWLDAQAGAALGHRRLAIVDLSDAGHQPMASGGGRYVLAFNGEIYNHLELRRELQAHGATGWRGRSDTETLLAGFDAWGIEKMLGKCVGMFAFAAWDRQERVLTLGRDRLGEKPLYYGWQGVGEDAAFLFGSELKALQAHPAFDAPVCRHALALFMRHSCVPAPYSIRQGIAKLPPGHLLTIGLHDRTPRVSDYWSGKTVVEQGLAQTFAGTPAQAVDALDALLRQAIAGQLMADVPLGALLSGGVDSSTVVALMQALAKERGAPPVRTFTIGFEEAGYDEAVHARAVARHLGTAHTELYMSHHHALAVIPALPRIYCEPFADSSQIPTYLVSQLARGHVTVSLSGDGGDELFGGYQRYWLAHRLWRRIAQMPRSMRRLAAASLVALSPSAWNRLLKPAQRLLPARQQARNWGDTLHKGAGILAAAGEMELYRLLVSAWPDPAAVVIDGIEPLTILTDAARQPTGGSFVHRLMALDMQSYLPDDILCKVDRAAMDCSLETRVPMLDHRVVEFAWSLPLGYKKRAGVSKWILREVLHRYVPRELIERPKMGFGIPLGEWLRGPLRGWAEELLAEPRLLRQGYFHPAPIRRKWAEHTSGQRNWARQLWTVLMFQSWIEGQGALS